jgi:nucleoside-diphosphate-sugar epimerase
MVATVALTGATGFIGGALVRALEQAGFRVRALVRPTSDVSRLAAGVGRAG